MSLIAVSIPIDDPANVDAALRAGAEAASSGAALVEWRVDALAGHDRGLAATRRLVAESPLPAIVTCRPTWEGGACDCDETTRLDLLEAVLRADISPRYIDVELAAFQRDASLATRIAEARSGDTGLIVSSHDFQGRPADLQQRVEAMAAIDGRSVIKIAWTARSLRDNLEAADVLLERPGPMIALCMGRFGLPSRVLAGRFGGLLTFAAAGGDLPVTAAGQVDIAALHDLYRADRIGPNTRVLGVIGWPVEHSRGPELHNAAMRALDLDGVYLPLPVADDYVHFKATVGALIDHERFGFAGASVTVPHKVNLLRFVQEHGGEADAFSTRIGAANTLIVGDSGAIACRNTDAAAAVEVLQAACGELSGRRVTLLGAGGVARAAVVGLADAGADVHIVNRNPQRAEQLAAELDGARVGASLDDLDVLINCTPLGMTGGPDPDGSPLETLGGSHDAISESTVVFDTVYTPHETRLLRAAAKRGATIVPGIDMFMRQADLQFRAWWGAGLPQGVVDRFRAS